MKLIYSKLFSSNDSAVMIAKLELKKMDEKKKLRSEKQRLKDLETPEEKRARRERKLSKKQKNVSSSTEESPAKVGWIFSLLCRLDLLTTENYISDNPIS